jgi:hypothetical protein
MSAKLKVVDDSRGAREAHHGEALAFGVVGSNRVGGRVACDARKQSSGRIRLLSQATWFNTPLVWLTFLCKSARAGSGRGTQRGKMLSFVNDYNNIGASCIGYVFMIRGCFRASQATHPPTRWEPATPYRPCAQHYSLGVITSGIALPIAGRLPPILLSTFLSSRIRSSTGG